ncbi:MAG: hypothetical protein ACXACC_08230 [Promethearchaeota archaeon]|jgi:hypothetical protein
MQKTPIGSIFRQYRDSFILFLVLFSCIFEPLCVSNLKSSFNQLDSEKNNFLGERLSNQSINENPTSLSLNNYTSGKEPIEYKVEQGVQFNLKTSQSKQMFSTSETNISIESNIINSSYLIMSNAEDANNDWKNNIEPDYGMVTSTKINLGNNVFYRLNFTENNQTPASGITNIKFNESSNPSPANFPIVISFDFQIPVFSPELINSPHTLALEFRFNNASINFILSDFGSNLGELLEENVTKPLGSDSLYILCNESAPLDWRHISYNVSRLIETYFSPAEYYKFADLKTLFCYMFAFAPGYQLTLDIDNIEYFTTLNPSIPIIYTLEGFNISTATGTLKFNSTMGNVTFIAHENSPWNNSLQTYLNVSLIRKKGFEGYHTAEGWNETHVKIQLDLNYSDLIEDVSFSVIYVVLPSDWTNLTVINQSKSIEFFNETHYLNDFIFGNHYQINTLGLNWIILEAWGPNYFSNIKAPVDINRNEIIQIRGNLRYPLPGNINLFLHNTSFIYHQTTLVMVNSTFIFSAIEINDYFPLGLLHLTLNWSYSFEYGVHEQLIYIHENTSELSTILFQSPQYLEIYQYESLLVNLSLHQNGEKYATNNTVVFLLNEDECLFFSRTSGNDFILNSTHIIWDPGVYILEIFASDGSDFFAKDDLNLTIRPASIVWTFENLPSQLLRNENISFRLYSYLQPQDRGIFYIFSGLIIQLIVNDTIEAEYITNLEGYMDIFFNVNYTALKDFLHISLIGLVKEKVCKFQTIVLSISNETAPGTGERAYIHEIMKTQARANKTFHIYYNIEYSTNNSSWYVPIESFNRNLISAFILRNNYVIGAQIEDHYLFWNLEANQTSKDTLVLELPCPTVYSVLEKISENFRIKITTFSDITVNNYSIDIDLSFLGFPFMNISLLDSLERDITNLFPTISDRYIISISKLNIIGGIEITYFLEGYFQEMEIEIWKPFRISYAYNESITGSWRIFLPANFSYSVYYSIQGLGSQICHNTNLTVFSNNSAIIVASLPPQRWNDSISIQLFVKYFSNLIETSSVQNLTISDPFVPLLDYSIESRGDQLRIHIFAFEPEKASGIENISVVTENKIFVADSSTPGYYIFEIPLKEIDSQHIKINAVDLAGNEVSTDYIDVKKYINTVQNLSEFLNPQIISTAVFSLVLVSGIFISRVIKKRKSSII